MARKAEVNVKFRLYRERLDAGGYTRWGQYFGVGEPLYCFHDDAQDYMGFVRGATRDDAKAAVRREFPRATFYR